jgi:hypothetical protein
MRHLLAFAFGVAVLCCPSTGHARPITYTFSGVLSTLGSAGFPRSSLSVGDRWSVSVTTDPTALVFSSPLSRSGAAEAQYAAIGSWTLGSVTGRLTGWVSVVSNGVSNSSFGFSTYSIPFMTAGTISPPALPGLARPGLPTPYTIGQIKLALSGPPSTSLALPTSLANYGPAGGMSFGPSTYSPLGINQGPITSFTVTTAGNASGSAIDSSLRVHEPDVEGRLSSGAPTLSRNFPLRFRSSRLAPFSVDRCAPGREAVPI